MVDTPASNDQSLGRRFNFLGLPSERRGGSISYPALRAELGDDNASSLVTKIGVLATVHGLDKLGVPLHHAVDRILQSLTPDERRSMAQGGTVPPRVEAIISAEAAIAKLQQQPTNIHGAGATNDASGAMLGRSPLPMSRGGNQFGALADRESASSTIMPQGLTPIQKEAFKLANELGLGWAANNPDLLRLGPTAIRALADVNLQKESYDRFHRGGLGARDIVEGARWSKRNNVDMNEASRAYESTHQRLDETGKKEHSNAVRELFNSHRGTPAEQEQAKRNFNERMEGLKKSNPGAAPHIDNEMRTLRTQQRAEARATSELKAARSETDDLLAIATSSTSSPTSTTTESTAPARHEASATTRTASAVPARETAPATTATTAPATTPPATPTPTAAAENTAQAKTRTASVAAPKPSGMA